MIYISANPRGRSYWGLDRYVAIMVAAAAVLLDPDASARHREQARRRFHKLHAEARVRWPDMFTDEKG